MAENALQFESFISDSVTEEVKVILEQLGNDRLIMNINKIITGLIPYLSIRTPQSHDCALLKKKLETLCMVLKIKYKFKHEDTTLKADDIYLISGEDIVKLCLTAIRESSDEKDACLPVLCDILCLSLLLLDDITLQKSVITIAAECQHALTFFIGDSDQYKISKDSVKPGIDLRILEAVLIVLSTRETTVCNDSSKEFKCNKVNLMHDDTLSYLILKLISSGHELLTAQTLLCIVPKLVTYTKNNVLLTDIWKHISIHYITIDSGINSTISFDFLTLCILADFYVPCHGQYLPVSCSLIEDDIFWKMIQFGITFEDPLIRKQALYLLKRAVDSATQANVAVNLLLTDPVFWWNPKISRELSKTWVDIFLILEMLEEKQVHLVKPVLCMVERVVESYRRSILHSSWVLCIFQRTLKHESNSIVKWGIMNLLLLDVNFFEALSEEYVLCLLESLMNALNNTFLYSRNGDQTSSMSEVGESLKTLFISFIKLTHCQSFFATLLSVLSRLSWGPVALFHVADALAAVPKTRVWGESAVRSLKAFVSEALSTHSVYIRGAVQCLLLEALIQLADEENLNLTTIADVLGSFRSKESLKRGNQSWSKTVQWLKSFVKEEDAQRFVQVSIAVTLEEEAEIDKQSLARMILLLSDAGLVSLHPSQNRIAHSLSTTIECLLDWFKNTANRHYICGSKQDISFEILVNLLEESQSSCNDDSTRNAILAIIHVAIDGIFICIKTRMFSVCHLRDFHSIHLYTNALETFSNDPNLLPVLVKQIELIQEASLLNVQSESPRISPVSVYFGMKILSWVSNCIKLYNSKSNLDNIGRSAIIQKQMAFVEKLVQNRKLNQKLVKTVCDEKLTRDLQTLWGRLVSGHLQAAWTVFATHLQVCPEASSRVELLAGLDAVLEDAMEALEIGGRGVLVPVMTALETILPKCMQMENLDAAIKFISVCWSAIFELRKTELFWIAMEKFIQMVFQRSVIVETVMHRHLLEYGHQIFSQGQAVTGLCNLLILQLQAVALPDDLLLLLPFTDLLVEAVLFGPVHRRDQRVDNDTCTYIGLLGDKCSVNGLISNDCGADGEVRARGICLLLALAASPDHKKTVASITEQLVSRDRAASQKKTRYFGDSLLHRSKHRMMQALLLIEPAMPPDESEWLAVWLCESLSGENHQPSVRYQQEWLLARMLLRHAELRAGLWITLRQASEKRMGSMCSFIAVALHVACSLPEGLEQEAFLDRSMQEILPWCMAQHFNVRLYAQVALQRLWAYSNQLNLHRVTEKYGVVQACLETSLEQGNTVRNAQKLLEDFYFSVFHPLNHYTLQTIFYELPRLANMTYEEWIPVSTLEACGLAETVVPLQNSSSQLRDYDVAAWILKSTGCVSETEESTTKEIHSNVQRKLIPWKSMIPDQDLLLSVSESVLRRKRASAEGGLVVVASLIDRPPNLGGLSRTCEVFGVSEYVLASLKYIEDKQFQSLSVSAERWIPISEVKPHQLPRYLEAMKKDGYTVVGAEQTANSTRLHELKFPRKCLLLLGNEKEGIPADLLPLLDICVEVPQQGLVRSLNVHVTGAIFIWEYSRQHSIK